MSAIRQLQRYRHDIPNRYSQAHKLLDHWDEPGLPVYLNRVTNPVRYLCKVVDLCLQSDNRASKLLNIMERSDPFLYDDLLMHGPQGEFREWWFVISACVVVHWIYV